MHDDQLRERFTTWAEPLRQAQPPALPALRRRARMRTARRAAVSALAAVAVAVAIIVVPKLSRAGHAPVQPAATAGVPPYAVVLGSGDATVRDMLTGAVLGRVTPPVARSDFQWVAAAADDRTFVLADQSPSAVTRFYLLRLAADGRPGRLAQLDVPPLHGSQVYGMALTADASRLAIAWQNDPVGPVASHVSVTTLATGATRTWASSQGAAVTVSWTGDHTLAVYWEDNDQQARSGLRLLDTVATGTSVLASRLILSASTTILSASTTTATLGSLDAPQITQDGSTVLATMSSSAGNGTVVVSFSARTGRLQAILTRSAPAGQSQWYCGVLWADPRGQHLITQCAATQDSIQGTRATPVRLAQLIPASPVGPANTFAW